VRFCYISNLIRSKTAVHTMHVKVGFSRLHIIAMQLKMIPEINFM